MWYAPRWYHWPVSILLLPLSALFAVLSALRRRAFALGLSASTRVRATVIVVGNVSVGGNGKTPMVVHLASLLSQRGYRPGVLTRGYGGKATSYPQAVLADSRVEEVGDEPMLMRQNLSCPLVVDPLRARGAQYLIDEFGCDVIICDDGLQHYALQRDIEIVVIDAERVLGNGLLLPAGPLREGAWRVKQADFVIYNGQLSQPERWPNGHIMQLKPGSLLNVQDPTKSCQFSELKQPVTALAGIGNPQRFFNLLAAHQITRKDCNALIDHHQFSAGDLPAGTVLMTEKDAVKCRAFAHPDCWYLPVTADLPDAFDTQLLARVASLNNY